MRLLDSVLILGKIDGLMKEEVDNLHKVMDILHLKHKQYADEIQTCNENNSVDQSEIKRLLGASDSSFGLFLLSQLMDLCGIKCVCT